MAAQGGPPFFSLRGGCTGGKVGLRPTLPPAHPTPPPLPVPHPAQTKFPRVINFDSPLNDSRQLEWGGGQLWMGTGCGFPSSILPVPSIPFISCSMMMANTFSLTLELNILSLGGGGIPVLHRIHLFQFQEHQTRQPQCQSDSTTH